VQATHRLREQRQFKDWDHVVAIAEKLTYEDAEKVESDIQRRCKEERKYITYKKYSKEHRARARNAGKKSPTPLENVHSVYMMWR
jgi:hypothetical protein